MKKTRLLLAISSLVIAASSSAITEVVRLAPDQYNIFLFNNGSGFIVTEAPVSNFVTGTFNCDVTGNGIFIPAEPELSDRVLANLLSAKVAGADIFLQVTDNAVLAPTDACRFQGSTYIGIDG